MHACAILLYRQMGICTHCPVWGICDKSPSAYRALSHALTVSLYLFLLKPQVFTWGGFRSSWSSGIDHQYATLMSPNQGETAVCGSSIFCWMTGEAITGCCK